MSRCVIDPWVSAIATRTNWSVVIGRVMSREVIASSTTQTSASRIRRCCAAQARRAPASRMACRVNSVVSRTERSWRPGSSARAAKTAPSTASGEASVRAAAVMRSMTASACRVERWMTRSSFDEKFE